MTATTDVEAVIAARFTKQQAIARNAAKALAELWRRVAPHAIASSWQALLGQAFAVVSAAQLASARSADGYVVAAMVAQSLDPKDYGHVNPYNFAGVAADGRRLDTLLYQPVVRALHDISNGASTRDALNSGLLQLDMIARTEIADVGRVSAGVSMFARGVGGYIRVVQPGACARCAILAGRWYKVDAGFLRHPRCQCVGVPAGEVGGKGLMTNLLDYFNSLSREEQDRIFTGDGAQAIRDGADISQVVNSRRGMYTAGGRSLTQEARRSRGQHGLRLTPEQIYREAQGSRTEAIRLLGRFGYLI